MTDAKFKKGMEQCVMYWNKYKSKLEEIEKEYERRFRHNPSDVDNDFWIDTFHQGVGDIDFDRQIKEAKYSEKLFNQ